MKKLKIFAVICLSVCAFLALSLITACKEYALPAPTNIKVDYNHKLTWDEVEEARSYVVEIKDSNGEIVNSKKEKREYTSLKNLEIGLYEIRIKAVGNEDGVESDWSTVFEFDRPYETGCVYTLVNNTEYHITGAGSASGDIVIEDYYRNKPVTAIADNAFKGNGRVTGIVLGNNITSIGKNAFYRCENLTSITIPQSVSSIGKQAFQRCVSLESIKIPDAVTTIDEFTFAYCRALKKIEFGKNVQYIGESAFSDCSGLTSVEIPESVVMVGPYAFAANSALETLKLGKNVQQIGNFAFQLCTALTKVEFAEESNLLFVGQRAFYGDTVLTSITLPAKVATVSNQAFFNCEKLGTVNLPNSLTKLGSDVFSGTAIQKAQEEAGDDVYYVGKWIVGCDEEKLKTTAQAIATTTNENYTTLLIRPDTVGISAYTFFTFEELTILDLPNSLKYIGDYAFAASPKLSGVTAKGCEAIGEYAFTYCQNLSRFDKCNNLQSIGGYAFYGCTWLKKFETPDDPDTLKEVGMYAFRGSGLWINSPDIVYIGEEKGTRWIVGANANITDLKIDSYTVGISDFAFYQSLGLNVANLASTNLKYIGQGAFYECISLTTVQFGANLKTIEDYTFYSCFSLQMIPNGFPRALETVGRSAFYNCISLTKVDFGRTVKLNNVGQYAFYGCRGITEVDLGDSVKLIDNYAFYGCEGLTELTLPDSLQSIGSRAFYKNVALEKVEFGNGLLSIGQYAFANCSAITEIKLPDSLLYVQKSAFYKCVGAKTVELGNSLQYVGQYAFYGLSEVTDLHLPTSLKYVGSYAFKGWNGLTSLLLPTEIETMGGHAFYGCKQVTIYTNEKAPEVKDGEVIYKWNDKFNSSHRPMVWGCTLSDDSSYVVSVTIAEDTFANAMAKGGFTAPERVGYVFEGWATEANGAVVYSAADIVKAPVGTTLYSVWTEAPEVTPDPETPEA